MKKRMMTYFMILVMMVVVAGGAVFFFRSDVSANNDAIIRYETVQIESGDTLWGIAERYHNEHCGSMNEYIDDIMEVNSLSSTAITKGCYLSVPVYTTDFK